MMRFCVVYSFHGKAVTHLRCGENYNVRSVTNIIPFILVKKFANRLRFDRIITKFPFQFFYSVHIWP